MLASICANNNVVATISIFAVINNHHTLSLPSACCHHQQCCQQSSHLIAAISTSQLSTITTHPCRHQHAAILVNNHHKLLPPSAVAIVKFFSKIITCHCCHQPPLSKSYQHQRRCQVRPSAPRTTTSSLLNLLATICAGNDIFIVVRTLQTTSPCFHLPPPRVQPSLLQGWHQPCLIALVCSHQHQQQCQASPPLVLPPSIGHKTPSKGGTYKQPPPPYHPYHAAINANNNARPFQLLCHHHTGHKTTSKGDTYN
jgi:hypothetical protein